METVAELNRRFGIAGAAEVVAGEGGLPAVRIHAAGLAGGLVYLHGAHVAAWNPAGQDEVLWMSAKSMFLANKPIRGGVPICFPWFGPRKGDPAAPGHGLVRLLPWTLEYVEKTAGGITVSLAIASDAGTRASWPADFLLRHRVTFGAHLTMALELTNTGTAELTADEALHTYFTVGDVRQVRISGLDATRYIDKMDGAKEKTQEGDILITAETDRVYLNTGATVTIDDPAKGRRIHVAKEQSRDTVVWNPWVAKSKAMPDFGDEEWPGMLCVETCNVGGSAVTLAPGQTHVMTARISVS